MKKRRKGRIRMMMIKMTVMMKIMSIMMTTMTTLMIIVAIAKTATTTRMLLMLCSMAKHLQRPVLTSLHAIPARAPRGPTVSVPLASLPPAAAGRTTA